MKRYATVVMILGILLIVWILASSISQIQPMTTSGSSGHTSGGSGSPGSGSGTGGGSGSGTGSGTGAGSGSGFGIGSLGNFQITLPKWNFKFPSLNLPKFNLPKFQFPSFNFSFPHIANPFNFSTPSGSGGGGGGSGGTSTPGQSSTSTTVAPQLPLISTLIIIIAAIIAAIIIGAYSIKSIAARKKEPDNREEPEETPLVMADGEYPDNVTKSSGITMMAGEVEAPIAGWSTGRDLIRPEIRGDLPLIWSDSDPLYLHVPDGSEITLDSEKIQKTEPDSVSVSLGNRCNAIDCRAGRKEERKLIRAINYSDDVAQLFRLNFLRDDSADFMTAREIVKNLENSTGRIVNRDSLFRLLDTYEMAFYGKQGLARKNYEDFLDGLKGGLDNAKAIICGET